MDPIGPVSPAAVRNLPHGRCADGWRLLTYAENRRRGKNTGDIYGGIFPAIPPPRLHRQAPDIGTAVTPASRLPRPGFLAGLRCACGHHGLAGMIAAPIAWKFALKDYQRSRVVMFMDPEQDPKGPPAGYPDHQDRGDGRIRRLSQGFSTGTRESSSTCQWPITDLIFSVLAEELGLIGVLAARE